MITFWKALIRGLSIEKEEVMFGKVSNRIPRIRDYSVNVNRLSSKRHINNEINGKDFRERAAAIASNPSKPKEQ